MSDPVTDPIPLTDGLDLQSLTGPDSVVVTLLVPPPPHFGYFLKSWIGGVRDLGKNREILIQGLGWTAIAERMDYLKVVLPHMFPGE